jgi:hypothetical protein
MKQIRLLCTACKTMINEGMFFCHKCGTRADASNVYDSPPTPPPVPPQASAPSAPQTKSGVIIITRKNQNIFSSAGYRVTINNVDVGTIMPDEEKIIPCEAETIEIEIASTSLLMSGRKSNYKLKTGTNPRVDFELDYMGNVVANFFDLEII